MKSLTEEHRKIILRGGIEAVAVFRHRAGIGLKEASQAVIQIRNGEKTLEDFFRKTGHGHARAERWFAENKEFSSSIDFVMVTTETGGSFDIPYDAFQALFGLEVEKNSEICFKVEAHAIHEDTCEVPR